MLSTLRLFKAVPVNTNVKVVNQPLLERTIKLGFVFSPNIVNPTEALFDDVAKLYGRDGVKLNQAFHKSWTKVKNAPIEQLVVEQIIHYVTTYGFEAAGFFDHDTVYIPGEVLEAPELADGLPLVVIRGLTKSELRAELQDFLSAGIALAEQTLADVLDVATYVGMGEGDIGRVRNHEAKAALYTYFGIVPSDPIEFVRYVVYQATNETLLIKNNELVGKIKDGTRNNVGVVRAFELYAANVGLGRLGEIFYRYKPLFLAFRVNSRLRQIVNEIRRAARTQHKPMPVDVLNQVTARLAKGDDPYDAGFFEALAKANTFRKIRLAYALKFRTGDPNAIVYRIRNGKSWVTNFNFAGQVGAQHGLDLIMRSIVDDVAKKVAAKTVYIPEGIHYGLPATEKQFTGNLPSGSYVEVEKNMVCGIHWTNVDGRRIDLDLSLVSAKLKLGWDAAYRNQERDILFSGDMTDAAEPNGASEFFYLDKALTGEYLLACNYFNYDSDLPVPFQIVVAKQKAADNPKLYVIDPNRILVSANATMAVHQKVLGIVTSNGETRRFYFAEFAQGSGRSARVGGRTEMARQFLLNYYMGALDLGDVLVWAGAKMVDDPGGADFDLSPESIDKATIIALLS